MSSTAGHDKKDEKKATAHDEERMTLPGGGLVVLFLVFLGVIALGVFQQNRTKSKRLEVAREALDAQKRVEDAKFVQIRRVTASVTSGQIPLPVTFTADVGIMPDASPVQCLWSFGDGSALFPGQVRVAYTYTTTGRFEARLTVIDAKGRRAVSEPVVIVTTGPLEVIAIAPSEGPTVAKREVEQESSFFRMARDANAWLGKVLPSEGKSAEPPEGVTPLRVGDLPVRRTLRPGERSPWFKMVGTGRAHIQCDGLPGDTSTQIPEPWSEPVETCRIWRFYNKNGVGELFFYLVQDR